MKRKSILTIYFFLCIALLFSSVVFAKGKDYVQGVTGEEILIGYFCPLTGSVAYAGLAGLQSSQLYFDKINATGGIYGRKITMISEDSACQPVKGVAGVKRMLAKKPFMILGGCCSGVVLSALPIIEREGIPWLIPIASTIKSVQPVRRNIFKAGSFPDNIQGMAMVDFAIERLNARSFAIINDASEYGQGGYEGIVKRLAEYGLEPVSREQVNLGDTDFTSQVLKVKEKNPEVVCLYTYAKEGTIVVRQAQELGLDAQFICCGGLSTPGFFKGAPPGVLVVDALPYLLNDPEPHIVNLVKELKANFRLSPMRPAPHDLLGTGGAMVVVEGLRKAGKDLTWDGFIGALESLKDFETGFTMPVTFSPTNHNGTDKGTLVVTLPGGRWQLLKVVLGAKPEIEPLKQ